MITFLKRFNPLKGNCDSFWSFFPILNPNQLRNKPFLGSLVLRHCVFRKHIFWHYLFSNQVLQHSVYWHRVFWHSIFWHLNLNCTKLLGVKILSSQLLSAKTHITKILFSLLLYLCNLWIFLDTKVKLAQQGRKLNHNETTKTIAETRMVTLQMTKRRTDFHTQWGQKNMYFLWPYVCAS